MSDGDTGGEEAMSDAWTGLERGLGSFIVCGGRLVGFQGPWEVLLWVKEWCSTTVVA